MAKRLTKKQKRAEELAGMLVIRPEMDKDEAEKFKLKQMFAQALSAKTKLYVFVDKGGKVNMEQTSQKAAEAYKEFKSIS